MRRDYVAPVWENVALIPDEITLLKIGWQRFIITAVMLHAQRSCCARMGSTNSRPTMPNTLISGPAGAGKSQLARELLAQVQGQGAIVDFQSIYAALLLLRRGDDGALS